ncbi:MAG: photosystem I reaction center subunit VIII [Nostocaceae cyanobacterium]|nr:photosystem I reaction center subunit VIII [Nostocaceae cyanobacterium]
MAASYLPSVFIPLLAVLFFATMAILFIYIEREDLA